MAGVFSKTVSCTCDEAGHTWNRSCVTSNLQVFSHCLAYAFKLYTPLYTVTALLNRRGKEYFYKKLASEIFQSSMFLGCNGAFMMFCFCIIRKIFGKFYMLSAGLLPGIICSYAAISIERKSRRAPLAIYMMNQALETCFNMLKSGGYAWDLPYGEVLIFSSSLAVVMYLYRSKNLPDGFVKKILQYGLGERKSNNIETDVILSIKQSARLVGQAFISGYGIQAVLNLLVAISSLFQKPKKVLMSLFKQANFEAGAFLGSLVATYKVVEKLLLHLQTFNQPISSAIAGGAAGIAMLILRSSYVAVYFATKTLELVYMNGIEKNLLPYFRNFDSILYAISTGIMFHAAVLQPLYLRPTYYSFLLRLTSQKFRMIDREKWEPFGLDSTKIDRLVEQGMKW